MNMARNMYIVNALLQAHTMGIIYHANVEHGYGLAQVRMCLVLMKL